MTMQEFVHRFDNATKEEIAQAMEGLPTDALEWAVKFEMLANAHPLQRKMLLSNDKRMMDGRSR